MTIEAEEKLKLCRQEFTEFSYKISHDLQAPLRSIIGFTNFLSASTKDLLNEQQKRDMSIIIQSAAHAQALIDALLHFSQLQEAELSPVKLDELVEVCIDQLQEDITSSQAVIQCGPLPEVIANQSQIELLLIHLLSNAIRFRKEDLAPVIQLSAEEMDHHWRITITDNGIGIDKEHHQVVFQLLRKLHADEEYPGLGTGLAYAKKIIELHQGEIGLDSILGRGTSIWFTLPHERGRHCH